MSIWNTFTGTGLARLKLPIENRAVSPLLPPPPSGVLLNVKLFLELRIHLGRGEAKIVRIQVYRRVRTHKQARTHARTYACMYACTRTHACMQAQHGRTHTYPHTGIQEAPSITLGPNKCENATMYLFFDTVHPTTTVSSQPNVTVFYPGFLQEMETTKPRKQPLF